MTASTKTTAASRAGSSLTDGLGLPRADVISTADPAGHALCGRRLCALRAREDAAGSDRLLADRTVLARHHRRAHGRHAAKATTSSRPRRWPISTSARRRPTAIRLSRSITCAGTPPRRKPSRRARRPALQMRRVVVHARRAVSTPMWRPSRCRPTPSCRRTTTHERYGPRTVADDSVPRLPRGVRMVDSPAQGGIVLLAPERVFKPDAIAHRNSQALQRHGDGRGHRRRARRRLSTRRASACWPTSRRCSARLPTSSCWSF